ncbi:uncharacterized protein LOC115773736 [Archocentrus centrarchus]|uniref:uncharacterized protein LOC115773736 n=1 Tax=Archocentrus centrarchus TaxID=63155 RepID=UPI0011EA21B7|nr:uncharacterized protein LOC115773736 [Archocentrus centrarchus]
METLDSYKPKEMSGEKAALDCWNFQVDLKYLEEILYPCLSTVPYKAWMSFDTNGSGSELVVLLLEMCDLLINTVSNLVLEIVGPLAFTSGNDHSCGDNVTVQGGCSHFKVMEKNIEACFGSSLNQYFVESLDIAEGSCDTLDELVRLFSAEITKKVNSALAEVTGSTLSLNTCDSLKAESTLQIVGTIGKLFKDVYKVRVESCDELVCPRCNSQKCCCFDSEDAENVEEDSTEISETSNRRSEMLELLDDLNPEKEPQLSDCSESNDVISTHAIGTFSSCPPHPEHLRNKTYLTVILAKLVDHIATKTRTSLEIVDLDQLVYSVTELAEGLLDFTALQSIDSLHISVNKSLCQKFRSKYVLQAAMESDDEAFDLAVSVTLISQLEKYKASKKRWNAFNPENLSVVFESPTLKPHREESSGKGSPVFESPTPEPHREERSKQTKPSPPKRSLCRTLRKKFSRWASNVVNFFKRSGQ